MTEEQGLVSADAHTVEHEHHMQAADLHRLAAHHFAAAARHQLVAAEAYLAYGHQIQAVSYAEEAALKDEEIDEDDLKAEAE